MVVNPVDFLIKSFCIKQHCETKLYGRKVDEKQKRDWFLCIVRLCFTFCLRSIKQLTFLCRLLLIDPGDD